MGAYVAGLGAAFAANAVTHMGQARARCLACLLAGWLPARPPVHTHHTPHPPLQPALLYLCPLTLGAVAGVAALRGELARVWAFTDTSATPPSARGK